MKMKFENFSMDDLIELSREIRDLIQDNNQNLKDCVKILNSIENTINPKNHSKIKLMFLRFINIFK